MATQTKENYLKAIYFLNANSDAVTVTALGKEMEVSKPTVNNMIKKLTANGWINYKKYKPISLTAKGKLQAALIVRKHRLTEMFLVQIMGFGWEEVHQIAEEMEHLKTEGLFDRMDEILGYPSVDPHGSPIPNKQGEFDRKSYVVLSSIPVGAKVSLRAVGDSSVALLHMLNEKEITLGTDFVIRKVEAFDKTMLVDYDGHKGVSLSYEVSKRLMVEEVSV
ncbi:MAG: DtxR family Mn-dependent transcriptional regulator [Saprospiraceae bacterium]|jgi:DtxR family Mn-dependent transcriptional regulator